MPETQKTMIPQAEFREAMSRLGAAVHVITSAGPAGECGVTASAVCSVTEDPPTVLVCLNRASETNRVLKANGVFCVNTLTAAQETLSDCFAGFTGETMVQRFGRAKWDRLVTGAPILRGALVSLDCTIASVTEVGTHSVMFGEIVAARFGEEQPALMYFKRRYKALHGDHPAG
jgi:flavin reductase